MPAKKRKTKKRKNIFVIIALILLIAFSFLSGVLVSAKKGTANATLSISPKNLLPTALSVQPVLPTASVTVPILVYHYVEFVKDPKDTVRRSLDILPPTLEQQIKTLKDAGYTFIVAADLGLYLDGKKPLPQKPIVLTFDDGYEDFYTDVFPILKKYNVVATEYVISGVLNTPNYMTTPQLREVVQSGLVEIGAHTITHPNLTTLPIDIAKKEIEESKSSLENLLGIKVVSFAYPYGGYNEQLAELTKKAGYTNATTTKGGFIVNQDNRYIMFRIHPGAAIGEDLLRVL